MGPKDNCVAKKNNNKVNFKTWDMCLIKKITKTNQSIQLK